MPSIKTLFLLILSLSLIICQNANKTEKKETNEHVENHSHNHTHEHFNESITNNTRKKPFRRDFNSKIPFNMTMDEMDTMMFCTVVVKESLQKERAKIDAVKTRLNISANPVYEKIGTEIFYKCNKNISLSFVNTYMKNFTYLKKFTWEKELDEIIKINYDRYHNETDLKLTIDEQILMYKYQKVDELFRQRRADQRDEYDLEQERENQKLKIGDIDVNTIPTSIKFAIFLVILLLLFGGVFYLLKTLEKKPKDKKKKKKKNE
jgi:hypothetical protein